MYGAYDDELLKRMRPDGVILVDNVALGRRGRRRRPSTDENTVAIRAFNDWLAADDRVETVHAPARRRPHAAPQALSRSQSNFPVRP